MKRLGLYYSSPQILSKMLGIQLYVSGVAHIVVSSDVELFILLLNHRFQLWSVIVLKYYSILKAQVTTRDTKICSTVHSMKTNWPPDTEKWKCTVDN